MKKFPRAKVSFGNTETKTTYLEVKVDKPGQRILVHGIDVCQVRDGKEQHAAVYGHLKDREQGAMTQ